MLSTIVAALAAIANAGSSVLQRKGAMNEPPDRRRGLRVVVDQLHHPVWFGGFGLLILGFLMQATALSMGSLALVQPILAGELPVTLVLAAHVFGVRLGRREWIGAVAMAGGLALVVGAASPSEGSANASLAGWVLGCGGVAVVLALVAVAGWRSATVARAALLGVTAGGLFGLSAAFMRTATHRAQSGPAELFGSWQLYAMALAGLAALVVLQQAYAAGPLAASQPGVTITDPVIAVVLGVGVFSVHVRTGWYLALELLGALAVAGGAMELSRSPVLSDAACGATVADGSGSDLVRQRGGTPSAEEGANRA